MEWVNQFNKLKKQANEELQETVMSLLLKNESKFEEIYYKISNILTDTKYGNKDFSSNESEINYITEKMDELIMKDFSELYEIFKTKALESIVGLSSKIAFRMRGYKQKIIINQRCKAMVDEMFEKAIEVFECVREAYLGDIKFYLKELEDRKKELSENNISKNIDIIYEPMEKYNCIKKETCSHKELIKMAIDLGYEYVRTGRHAIYRNRISKKTIPIPIHSKPLGLGISIAIQKQLIDRASI